MVAFTVSKVCNEGLFVVEATGIRIKYDTLSHETVQNIDYGKAVDFLVETSKQQQANGTQYLQMAKTLIAANLSEFNQCTNPIITAPVAVGWTPYDTKGVLGL